MIYQIFSSCGMEKWTLLVLLYTGSSECLRLICHVNTLKGTRHAKIATVRLVATYIHVLIHRLIFVLHISHDYFVTNMSRTSFISNSKYYKAIHGYIRYNMFIWAAVLMRTLWMMAIKHICFTLNFLIYLEIIASTGIRLRIRDKACMNMQECRRN